MKYLSCLLLLSLFTVSLAVFFRIFIAYLTLSYFQFSAAQYYTSYNPYQTPNPTFSSLSDSYNNYYYNTPNSYYNYYPTPSPYSNAKIRIWPFVIGQYLYPSYYNSNSYNPYASLNTLNWQTYYANAYQNNWGKK